MPKFNFDEVVRCTIDNSIFPVKVVMKIHGSFLYLAGNIWIPEKFLDKTECKSGNTSKLAELKAAVSVAVKEKKLFAYTNIRTSKVDHYEWEWAGNQFSIRTPEHDLVEKR